MPAPHRPLEGLRVVDLSRYLPGPLVTRLLGDLGARVVKVEEPVDGDPVRQAPPFSGETSALGAILLHGHESLALDLKKPAARAALLELLGRADVLVESFRPGTLEGFGLAPAELRACFPRLVICSLTGWGQEGPHAHRAGHDLGYQAIAGSLAATGQMPAVQVADVVGAWSAALAVTAALVRRGSDGEGCWIDQALLDAAAHANLTGWAAEADGPKALAEPTMLTGALPSYRLYATRDGGQIALAALEPRFWRRFCQAVGRRDLVRAQFQRETERELAELFAAHDREEWTALFAEHDLPAEPVLSAAEARAHPQMRHRALARTGDEGLLRLGFPALFDGVRPAARDHLAALGESTGALLAELGLAPAAPRRGIGRPGGLRRWLGRLALRWGSKRPRKDRS